MTRETVIRGEDHPAGITSRSAATRGLYGEFWSAIALTSWISACCATTRPKQATMIGRASGSSGPSVCPFHGG